MIHAAHPTHLEHPAHVVRRKRHARRTWILAIAIVLATGVGIALGTFHGVSWDVLLWGLFQSFYRLAAAYAIALVLGAGLALLIGAGPFSDVLFPFFDVLQNIPSFALIPVFGYFFGYTDVMIIIFAATSIVWPILFAVLTAIRSARIDWNDAATIFGATGLKRLRYYLAPLSFPAIVTGSVVGMAIGWEAVIGAEIIGNAGGFGAFINTASTTGISPSVIAGTIAILLLVFILNRLIWSPLLNESSHRYAE